MAAWLPALKALLPYATQIVTAAIPAFTRKTGAASDVVPEQIQELHGAVIHNAESVKTLATQMRQVITSIDSGAVKIEHDMRTIKRLSIIAIVLSLLAVALCIASWAVNAR